MVTIGVIVVVVVIIVVVIDGEIVVVVVVVMIIVVVVVIIVVVVVVVVVAIIVVVVMIIVVVVVIIVVMLMIVLVRMVIIVAKMVEIVGMIGVILVTMVIIVFMMLLMIVMIVIIVVMMVIIGAAKMYTTKKKRYRLVEICQFCWFVAICQQVATNLSISSRCSCHLQTCYNLSKQLAASLWLTSVDNQPATNLLTTRNRLVVNKLSQTMRTNLDIGLFFSSLLQDVTRLVATCLFLAVYLMVTTFFNFLFPDSLKMPKFVRLIDNYNLK